MIAAIILSAGASTRMGRPKALLPASGAETFLGRIVYLCQKAGAGPVVVAIGPPHGPEIQAAWSGAAMPAPGSRSLEGSGGSTDLLWAENPDPGRGMLSSVQEAVRLLPSAVQGTLIWPVDIPYVAIDTVRLILRQSHDQMVIPAHGGRGGHPIFLPARFFAELSSSPPQAGLRKLRQDHLDEVCLLPVTDAAILRDVDTLADLHNAVHDHCEA